MSEQIEIADGFVELNETVFFVYKRNNSSGIYRGSIINTLSVGEAGKTSILKAMLRVEYEENRFQSFPLLTRSLRKNCFKSLENAEVRRVERVMCDGE